MLLCSKCKVDMQSMFLFFVFCFFCSLSAVAQSVNGRWDAGSIGRIGIRFEIKKIDDWRLLFRFCLVPECVGLRWWYR